MPENALTEATYYILLALVQPRHGYGIMQETERLSKGRVHLAAGTLYGALNALCARGWIVLQGTEQEGRRKIYCLSEKGEEVLYAELRRLKELVENGESVLEGNTEHE